MLSTGRSSSAQVRCLPSSLLRLDLTLNPCPDAFGTSIYASTPLPAHTPAVSCPFSIAITPALALSALSSVLPSTDDHELMVTYLALHRLSPSDLPSNLVLAHKVYVDSLPKEEDMRTPLYFGAAEMELLKGTNLFGATEDRRNSWTTEWKHVVSILAIPNPALLTWFVHLPLSSRIRLPFLEGNLPLGLHDPLVRPPHIQPTAFTNPPQLPRLPLLPPPQPRRPSHSRPLPRRRHVEPRVRTARVVVDGRACSDGGREEGDVDDCAGRGRCGGVPGCAQFLIPRSSGADAISATAFNTCTPDPAVPNRRKLTSPADGPKPSEELLLGYGFVTPSNAGDTVALKLSLSPTRHVVPRSGVLPSALILEIRRLVATAEEKAREVEGWMGWENELEALGMLGDMLEGKLGGVLGGAGEGEGARKEVREMCEEYRRGQVEILQKALEVHEGMMGDLERRAEEAGVVLFGDQEDSDDEE